jgi:hypothetical protein
VTRTHLIRRALLSALAASLLACAADRAVRGGPSGLGDDAARDVLRRFSAAVVDGRAADALPLLSARWRERYTAARLSTDLGGAGPAAREAAARVLRALDDGVALERADGRARIPVGVDREAVVVDEGGSWKVDAME